MKKKYGLLSNFLYLYKIAWDKRENLLILILLLKIISGIFISGFNLFFIPNTISMIEKNIDFFELTKVVSFIFLIYIILKMLNECLDNAMRCRKIEIRTVLINNLSKRNMTMPYELTLKTKLTQLFSKASNSMNGNDSFAENTFDVSYNLVINIIMIIIYIFVLTILPWYLIAFTIVTSYISFYIGKKIKDWRYENREKESEYISKIYYNLGRNSAKNNVKDIKLFGLEIWLNDVYESLMTSYDAFQSKTAKKVMYASLIESIIDLLRNSITYYFLIKMVLNKNIDVSMFLLLFTAQTNFANDINIFFENLYELVKYSNDISICREFFDYKNPYELNTGISIESMKTEDIHIELKNVYFKYEESDEYILENINLEINPKDKIAIVGMNGSGKTTLIKIIMGFLEPTKGEVLLNGTNLKQYKRNDYYKLFSAVFQDVSILPESVKLNVTQDMNDNNIEKIKKVLKISGLYDKVMSFDKGIDTVITKDIHPDAIELSGGEKQKLLLARAIYRNSQFLVLDEPSAALDSIAEKELYEKYNNLTENLTSIFISHRMASTRFCDYILLIKDKKIYEKGTHDELMKLNGEYKYIFDVQSKYYKEEFNELA